MAELSKIEKNLSTSFSYVKKDILMLNDAFADLNEKVQRIALEQEEIKKRLEKLEKKKTRRTRKR